MTSIEKRLFRDQEIRTIALSGQGVVRPTNQEASSN
jgi:hypothetical protein